METSDPTEKHEFLGFEDFSKFYEVGPKTKFLISRVLGN